MFDYNTLIKIICFILSVIGLVFHSTELFGQYLSGKTVVNLMIGRRYEDTLPGITICYPIALSMNRTAQLNDRTMEYYEEYDKLINNLDNNLNIIPRKRLKDLQNKTNDELEKWQGSMLDYFNNYTVDHNQIKMTEDNKIHDGKWTEEDKSYPIEPIESYVQFGTHQSKCFSYFTVLQKDWRNFLTSFTMLNIAIDHGVPFRPMTLHDHIYIAFHSPNILPDLIIPGENYIELKLGYDIGLSFIRVEHLEQYDSGCINYDYSAQTETLQETLRFCKMCHSHKSLPKKS